MIDGKILDEEGVSVKLESSYRPQSKLLYFREVDQEPEIPFAETILYQDNDLLVADKPHFLPVTPGGRYVEECLLNRLRRRTGLLDLVPLHRIDRGTAGILLFSVNRKTRGDYAGLFLRNEVAKSYQALAVCTPAPEKSEWIVENRIERSDLPFRMQVVSGKTNTKSVINLLDREDGIARFSLQPFTGKTHQLRLHLSGLGFGILNDRLYPELQEERPDNFAAPLQLLARMVTFRDPLSQELREFTSAQELSAQI